MNKSVVLIAGGPTVIGTAAAVAFAKKGARVVAAGRRDEAGKALVKDLRSFGSEAEFINAGVRKEDDIRALRSTRMFSASILNMKREVRVTRGRGSGSILNISSTCGHEGVAGASVYVGSKHAVEGITKSVALEIVKSGNRVNGVAPGPTDTGMLTCFTGTQENKAAPVTGAPMGRVGTSEEPANAIVFIASDEASFITSHILNVDGGRKANLPCSGDRDCAREPTITTHTRSTLNTYQAEGRSPVANVIKKHSISYELAQKMANAAVAKATELGVTENVAILDDGGNLKAFSRMDGTPIPTIEIAQNKAYTALFGVSTQDFFNFIQDDPSLLAGIPALERVSAWGGGFPIKVNGEVVGAIGVSGAPKVQNDVDCARAALALVPDATPTEK
jgi:NAD(P)-dependent dehydrogenase (short-subunit alcohol dehydrogenase family)/uncharacterized protein GlcG (DUF336 family)